MSGFDKQATIRMSLEAEIGAAATRNHLAQLGRELHSTRLVVTRCRRQVKFAGQDRRALRFGVEGAYYRLTGAWKAKMAAQEEAAQKANAALQVAEQILDALQAEQHRLEERLKKESGLAIQLEGLLREKEAAIKAAGQPAGLTAHDTRISAIAADQADIAIAQRHLTRAQDLCQFLLEESPAGMAGGVDVVAGGVIGLFASEAKHQNLLIYWKRLIELENALRDLDATACVHAPELVELIPSWSPTGVRFDYISEIVDPLPRGIGQAAVDIWSLVRNRAPDRDGLRLLWSKLAQLRMILMERANSAAKAMDKAAEAKRNALANL